jgi:hypothetical protein
VTSPRQSLLSLCKDPPRPWHLLLTPVIPLLGLLKEAVWFLPATVIIAPATVAVGAALILALVLVPLGFDRHRSALAVSLVVLVALSHQSIALPLVAATTNSAVYVLFGVVALGVLKLLRTAGSATNLTVIANRTVAIAVLIFAAPIVWSEWRRPRSIAPPLALPATASVQHPDVYVIVLDGYGRQDVLRDNFDFDNGLIPDLHGLGFFVVDRAAANYSQTALSLASALNTDYLPQLKPAVRNNRDRRGLGDLVNDSRFFRAFAAAGYRIRAYGSEYALVHPRLAHERPSPLPRLDDFGLTAYETTVVPRILDVFDSKYGGPAMQLHRRHITWALDHLAQAEPHDRQPVLVFAHILAPHPPFAFAGNGGPRPTRMPALLHDADMWDRLAAGKNETYKDGYLDTVRSLNTGLATALRAITARNRQSIILIHGDHGPGAGLVWEEPERSDMRERMSILAAVRFPDGVPPPLQSNSTPVNLYRAVLNRALGTGLPLIENRSFHSTWERPFDFTDVTGRLN